MELKLTNEQLALLFDEELKGDIISDGSYTYKITDPVLEVNGLYKDEIEYELSETPILKEYNNTVLLTTIPMEHGVVYDSIILAKKEDLYDISYMQTEGKSERYYLNVDWTTYDFGSGQDYAPDDEHEEEFYKEVELYDTNVQPDADMSLHITVERIINTVKTLTELIEEDTDDDWKLEILDGSIIQDDESLHETIEAFIEYLNRYSDSYGDPLYTYVHEDDTVKIYKTDPSEYKTKLEAEFKIIKQEN